MNLIVNWKRENAVRIAFQVLADWHGMSLGPTAEWKSLKDVTITSFMAIGLPLRVDRSIDQGAQWPRGVRATPSKIEYYLDAI